MHWRRKTDMKKYILPLMLLPFVAGAQPLSLKDAVSIGLKNSFDIQSEKVLIEVRKEQITQEDAKFDPIVTANAGAKFSDMPTAYAPYNTDYLREKTYSASAGISKLHHAGFTGAFSLSSRRLDTNNPYENLDPSYKTVLRMDLTLPILKNFGKDINATGLKQREIAMQQARLELYSKMVGKTEEIETAYRNLARTTEVLKLNISARELASELLESDRKRFNAGIVPITEVQEAEAAVAVRDEQVVLAKTGVADAMNKLNSLLNPMEYYDELTTEPLAKNWIEVSTGEEYETALKARPDIENLRAELAKQDLTIKYLKNQELPELDVVNTLGVIGLSGSERTDNHFEGNYADSLYDMSDAEGYEAYIGLSFKYPLGQRASKAQTAAANSEKRRAVYRLKNSEVLIKKEIHDAATIITNSKERYEISLTSIRLAETTLEQEMKKLKEGLSDTFRILKFQNDVISAKIRSINALYDYNRGIAMLYKADGTNLDRLGFKIGEND
jgi:outer membrane protein TolC